MTKVSRKLLNKKIEGQIFDNLWESLSQLKNKKDIEIFLADLLTPTERIMTAKRLAIAVLLLKNMDYGRIKETVKVSNETISKVSTTVKYNHGYQLAVNKIIKTEAGRKFWADIEDIIWRLGNPSKTLLPEHEIKPIRKRYSNTLE